MKCLSKFFVVATKNILKCNFYAICYSLWIFLWIKFLIFDLIHTCGNNIEYKRKSEHKREYLIYGYGF